MWPLHGDEHAPEIAAGGEPTSALDVTVQAQVVKQMMDLRDKMGTAIVIVTHNMGLHPRWQTTLR